MEAKRLEATIRIDADGHLIGDAEVLARLSNQTFTVRTAGATITLEPATPHPRRLHELEDTRERELAYQELKRRVTHPGGASLSDDWASLRDSIYD